MADHMTAEQLLDAMADSLSRAVEQMWHECDCEACPECGQSPHACSGTACAETCQCSMCDFCAATSLIAAAKQDAVNRALDEAGDRGLQPPATGSAEQLRAELLRLSDYASRWHSRHHSSVLSGDLQRLAARLSGMAAVVPKGWKPLPPAATPEMVAAFWATPGDQSVEFRYVRMFAAAPEPPHV